MRIVVALGGNALLRRGEPLTAQNQQKNIQLAAKQLAKIKPHNELIIAHGNGPQVGLLALKNLAYTTLEPYPLDILVSKTVGMIGYLLQQELSNVLPQGSHVTTLLTRIEVDKNDPAFTRPTKPIGPVYSKEEADNLAREKGWVIAPDGDKFRRVVPSPLPKRLLETDQIKWLLEKESVVICGGGGGIPVYFDGKRHHGIEAVVDKDLCSSLISENLNADLFVIATDVPTVYLDFANKQQAVKSAHPDELEKFDFPAGSMGPKVQAVINFVRQTGKDAVIGALSDIEEIVKGNAGTRISVNSKGIVCY